MRLCFPHSLSLVFFLLVPLSFCLSLSYQLALIIWLLLISGSAWRKKKVKRVRDKVKFFSKAAKVLCQECAQCIRQYRSDRRIVRGHFNHNHMSFLLCLFYFYCSILCWQNHCKIVIKLDIYFVHMWGVVYSLALLRNTEQSGQLLDKNLLSPTFNI